MVQKALKKNPNKRKGGAASVQRKCVLLVCCYCCCCFVRSTLACSHGVCRNAPKQKVIKASKSATRKSIAQTHKRLQKKAHSSVMRLIEKDLAERAIKNDGNNPMRLLKVSLLLLCQSFD